MSQFSKSFLRMLLLFLAIHVGLSLRNAYIRAPEAATRNAEVEFSCLYDLDINEELYSVKWYRGDREFCRYSPNDAPRLRVFPLQGIEVVPEKTDAERLTIVPGYPQSTAEGKYICEVSADMPSFQTARVHTFLYVIDKPRYEVEMKGFKDRYKVGMRLKAECVCRDSLPPANFTFYINEEEAVSARIRHRVDGNSTSELMTAYSSIQFVVQKHHFDEGRIRLRCVAMIYDAFYWSLQKAALQEVIHTTAAPLTNEDMMDIFKRPKIHRKPKTSASDYNWPIFTLSCLVAPVAFVILPTALT